MSLLEQAKSKLPSRRAVSPEEIELAVAWLKGDINGPQAAYALGIQSGNINMHIARLVKAAFKAGAIVTKGGEDR